MINAIVLEYEIKKLDGCSEENVFNVRRNMLEMFLERELQLLWKDVVTAQQLGSVSDGVSEDGDDDAESFMTISSDDEDSYGATYDADINDV